MLNLIFFATFSAITLGGCLLWWFAFRRFKVKTCIVDPLGERDLVGSPYGLTDVLLVFFAWFGGQLLSVGLAMFLFGFTPDGMAELGPVEQAKLLGMIGLGQLLATLAALAILWFRYRFNWNSISIQPKQFRNDVVLGIAAFAMVIPIILFIQWVLTLLVPYEHASLDMLTRDASFLTFAAVWFAAGIVAPITEEVFFRGVVQAWLQRLGRGRMKSDQILIGGWDAEDHTEQVVESGSQAAGVSKQVSTPAIQSGSENPYEAPQSTSAGVAYSPNRERSWVTDSSWPIFVSAAFFAFMHMGQGAAPIPLFFFAVVLGYLFKKTGSLLPCIVLHMLLNMFSLFWYTLNLFFGEVVEPSVATPEMAWLLDLFF